MNKSPSVPVTERHRQNAGSGHDPFETIRTVQQGLFDKLFIIVLTLGTFSVVASVIRTRAHGWNSSIVADIVILFFIIAILALRRRLRVTIVFWSILGAVAVEGLISLMALGLASAAMMILSCLCIMVSVFYGIRSGITVMAVTLAVSAGIAVVHGMGIYRPLADLSSFIHSPQTWITQITAFSVYSLSVMVAAHSVQRRLLDSVNDLNTRSAQLAGAVERIRESERKYRTLADSFTDVVFVQDMDMRIIYVSQSVEPTFGYTIAEALNLRMDQFLTPESFQRAMQTFSDIVPRATQSPVDMPLMETLPRIRFPPARAPYS